MFNSTVMLGRVWHMHIYSFIFLEVHMVIVTILIIIDCLTQLLIFMYLTWIRWKNKYESFIFYTNIIYCNAYHNTMQY